MRILLITLLSVFFGFTVQSQDFKVPEDVELKQEADFKAQEQNVRDCFHWMMDHAPDAQADKRKDADAFMMQWLSECPYLTISINADVVTFADAPELLMVFMGSWAEFSIRTGKYDDEFAGSLAGLDAVMDYYQRYKDYFGENEHVEKFLEMKAEGTLEKFVVSAIE